MPPEQLIRKSGHIADGDSDQDKMIKMAVLHDNVDLTDHACIDIFKNQFLSANGQMSPYKYFDVYDQGEAGSCTSNAVAAAYRYMLQRHGMNDFIPSRLFMYSEEKVRHAAYGPHRWLGRRLSGPEW
jgi:hypothetical protein